MSTLRHLSDNDLFDLFKSGDQIAYLEIYDRYTLILLNHAYNKTRSREEAKDVVQEVFTNLWAKREQINCHSNLSGYLYSSLRNNILNRIARQSLSEKYAASFTEFLKTEVNHVITDHLVREHELAALIEKEIAALPSKMRQVFELSRKQHLSHKEIADQLLISEQTVSKHITNPLKLWRVRLGFFVYLLVFFHLL